MSLSEQDVIQLLREEVTLAGSASQFAKDTGLHEPDISRWLNGKRKVTPALLRALGIEKVYQTVRR